MSSVVISGDTSGAITVSAPLVAGTNTLTLQAATATNAVNTLATAVASTSGTSIDFTGLPSWIKRITVMFNAVSLSGSSNPRVQIGAGSIETTGYAGAASSIGAASVQSVAWVGGGADTYHNTGAAQALSGHMVLTNISSNIWIISGVGAVASTQTTTYAGAKTTSGTLDRLRITTVNGTDTFDAGSVNILYEG